MMTLKEAMKIRTSRRSFTDRPLSREVIHMLETQIQEANAHPGQLLDFHLVTNDKKAFSGLLKTYGLFSGVHSYIVAAGKAENIKAQELLGYYGELMVLKAAAMGVASCWVGASYDKSYVGQKLPPSDKLYCVIALGYANDHSSMGEKLARRFIRHDHTPDEVMEVDGSKQPPRWFMDGINAVLTAPSARGKLPVHFSLKNGIVTCYADENMGYEYIDLGIAKLHFELGADYIFYDLRS